MGNSRYLVLGNSFIAVGGNMVKLSQRGNVQQKIDVKKKILPFFFGGDTFDSLIDRQIGLEDSISIIKKFGGHCEGTPRTNKNLG